MSSYEPIGDTFVSDQVLRRLNDAIDAVMNLLKERGCQSFVVAASMTNPDALVEKHKAVLRCAIVNVDRRQLNQIENLMDDLIEQVEKRN
jgi:hypothetical protein